MYERLERRGRIRRHEASTAEVTIGLEHADRDLRVARGLLGSSQDWALTAAHNASILAGRAYMAAAGYRPCGAEGHKTVLAFLRESLHDHGDLIDYLDHVRVKRNAAVYDAVGTVSETEAATAVHSASELVDIVRQELGA